jgi:hypothetical protein
MFIKLYKLYDFLSCLVRWWGAVYVWRPKQNYLYIFNKNCSTSSTMKEQSGLWKVRRDVENMGWRRFSELRLGT